ncbi:MAG: cob(I)yrinic acid a,c-diamide adenosyltransferase, partial [Syntrophaceae bacterium]|nr:cob(I)yrinic acid a,c-diamide adenosyltransferase [Syntrophaceae bacterium]
MEAKGRILIFTGDGKGKTTAALGMALRAHGYGIPIAVIQMVKEDTATGEYTVLTRLPDVTITVAGRGFVPQQKDPAWQEHRRAAEEGLR